MRLPLLKTDVGATMIEYGLLASLLALAGAAALLSRALGHAA